MSSPKRTGQVDELDAILGDALERARAAMPAPDPLGENPRLAAAIEAAVALSPDGTAFGMPGAEPHERLREAPPSERVEHASVSLAPMRQVLQPVAKVQIRPLDAVASAAGGPVRLPPSPAGSQPVAGGARHRAVLLFVAMVLLACIGWLALGSLAP